tara:strand:+ start:577 stop:795 length:219 start_codon:yes stop_codon:yes gene_type:complete
MKQVIKKNYRLILYFMCPVILAVVYFFDSEQNTKTESVIRTQPIKAEPSQVIIEQKQSPKPTFYLRVKKPTL